MTTRPARKPDPKIHAGTELSDALRYHRHSYKEDQRRFIQAGTKGTWNAEGHFVLPKRCMTSGSRYEIVYEAAPSYPSGRRIVGYSSYITPKYSKAAKRERRLLADLGMLFSEDEVRTMFNAKYKERRAGSVPHNPFGAQNFNDQAVSHSVLASAMCEWAGREYAGFVTHLLRADVHQGPGTFCEDPMETQHRLTEDLRSAFPHHFIMVIGFMEFLLRDLEWNPNTRSFRFIVDSSRRRKSKGSAEGDYKLCASTNEDGFIRGIVSAKHRRLYEGAAAWAGSEAGKCPPIEVPHAHYLIWVFDRYGQPISFAEIKDTLHKLSKARHSIEMKQLYEHSSKGAQKATPRTQARFDHSNGAGCLRYAIKKSSSDISDRDIQARTLFRGLLPQHGFMNFVVPGTSLARCSKASREIPENSMLGTMLAERKRIMTMAGLECPNNGQPELIKELSRRRRRMGRPFRLTADGQAVRSKSQKNSIVSNSSKNTSQPIDHHGNHASENQSGLIEWFKKSLKWFKGLMPFGP